MGYFEVEEVVSSTGKEKARKDINLFTITV